MAYEAWILPSDALKAFMRADYEKWVEVIRRSGAKID